jgi:GNAT superfamily N-acetyltransferase
MTTIRPATPGDAPSMAHVIIAVAACSVIAPDRAEVGALYVRQSHQRSGVGRMLLRAIIDHYGPQVVYTWELTVS